MNFTITRDSVCAGDDADAPHEVKVQLPDNLSVEDLLQKIGHGYIDLHYPEQIWVCRINDCNVALYSRGRKFVLAERVRLSMDNSVHFIYVWNRTGTDLDQLLDKPELGRWGKRKS